MTQKQAALRRCRVCSRALAEPGTRRYCATCQASLEAIDPGRRHGLGAMLSLTVQVGLIVGVITLIVFGLAVLPVWLALQIGPLGFLAYFFILPAGAAFGALLEHVGLRAPPRKRKVL